VLAVGGTVPWTRQRWALPFLGALATTPEVSPRLGRRHKTLGMRAHQLVSLLRRGLPGGPIKLMGDLAYRILAYRILAYRILAYRILAYRILAYRIRERGLHCTQQPITRMAPLRLDSVIHQPPPGRSKPTRGRPPVGGKRLPSIQHLWPDPQTVWQRLTLDW